MRDLRQRLTRLEKKVGESGWNDRVQSVVNVTQLLINTVQLGIWAYLVLKAVYLIIR